MLFLGLLLLKDFFYLPSLRVYNELGFNIVSTIITIVIVIVLGLLTTFHIQFVSREQLDIVKSCLRPDVASEIFPPSAVLVEE